MDLGFTNSSTTLIAVYRYNKALYMDELIYQTGLVNSDIIARLNELNIPKHNMIVIDCAEPKTIEDLRRAGFRTEKAKKGDDGIRNGISELQSHEIFITKRSLNTIKEFRNYIWAIDKEGKATNIPVKKDDHAMDAIRYVALNRLKKSTFFIQ
jgi:phage terminase large subunit